MLSNHKKQLPYIAILAIAILLFCFSGLRVNITNSFPVGIYKLDTNLTLKRGDMIMFCAPKTAIFELAYDRGYILAGSCENGFMPLQKKIVAIAGDRVEFKNNEIFINGLHQRNGHVFKIDSNGRNLPKLQDINISTNELFVMSDYNERSFDGRYFGAIKSAAVVGHLKPIVVYDRGLQLVNPL